MNHFDILFKIVILGNTRVGKTCILQRLTKQTFDENQVVTIGAEFGNYGMIINNETFAKLQVWDTAGQETFRSITRNFYKGAEGVCLVFDITKRQTFSDIQNVWLREIRNHASPSVVIYLIGNFADLEDQREVSYQEAFEFAQNQQLSHYIETSAKTAMNINQTFETFTKHLYLRKEDEPDDDSRQSEVSDRGLSLVKLKRMSEKALLEEDPVKPALGQQKKDKRCKC